MEETAVAAPVGEAKEARLTIGKHLVVLERTASGGTLRLIGEDGSQPLEIELGPNGPVLRLRAGISIAVEGAVALSVDKLAIDARRELSVTSGGPITVHAAGDLVSEASAHKVVAHLGDVAIQANDDVRLNGERIKLNC